MLLIRVLLHDHLCGRTLICDRVLRLQLKEETGYVGAVAHCSEVLAMSPGLCDETIKLCVVEVCGRLCVESSHACDTDSATALA